MDSRDRIGEIQARCEAAKRALGRLGYDLTAASLSIEVYNGFPDTMHKELKQMLSIANVDIPWLLGLLQEFKDYETAYPIEEWHEDFGPALFWKFPIEDMPYFTSPLFSEFDELQAMYGWTHFTKVICPRVIIGIDLASGPDYTVMEDGSIISNPNINSPALGGEVAI